MQKKWIAGGLLVLGLLGMCGCSSQAFVSEQQTGTVLTQEETGLEFQDGRNKGRKSSGNAGMEQPQL